jgi:hypothetical protein
MDFNEYGCLGIVQSFMCLYRYVADTMYSSDVAKRKQSKKNQKTRNLKS